MTDEEFDNIKVGDELWIRGRHMPVELRVCSRTANMVVAIEPLYPAKYRYTRHQLVTRNPAEAGLTEVSMLDALISHKETQLARKMEEVDALNDDIAALRKRRAKRLLTRRP